MTDASAENAKIMEAAKNAASKQAQEPSELEKLQERKKKLEARIRKIQNAENAKIRKEETRKKIIAGGWFLKFAETDAQAKELFAKFIANLSQKEKELF